MEKHPSNSPSRGFSTEVVAPGTPTPPHNYGMDESFRREMARVFPSKKFVELPAAHSLFSCHFRLPQGLPKIHEHEGRRPQALGLFEGERLILLYTFESDLGDGWEESHVHGNSEEKRRAALEMGTNIVVWSLIQ